MFKLFTHFAFSEHFRSFGDQVPFWTNLAGQWVGIGVQTIILSLLTQTTTKSISVAFLYVQLCMLSFVYVRTYEHTQFSIILLTQ